METLAGLSALGKYISDKTDDRHERPWNTMTSAIYSCEKNPVVHLIDPVKITANDILWHMKYE